MFNRHKKTDMSNIIFIDIDDTLANTRQAVYDIYVETTGDKSGDINVKSKRYSLFCPEWDDKKVEGLFLNSEIIYSKTKPIAGAKEAVATLEGMGYDLRVATLHKAEGIPAKQKWIDEHFPTLSNKVCYLSNLSGNKDIFCGYAIIDDDEKNTATNRSSKTILLDVYNVYGQKGVRSWKEVIDKLK